MSQVRRPSRHRGFTLIELFAVIGIIAVLIALLLPALALSRRSPRGGVCLSNMHQYATGWSIYADTYHGAAVPGQPGDFDDASKNVYWVGNGEVYRPRWYVLMGAGSGIYAFSDPDPSPELEHSQQIDNKVYICPETPTWTSTRNCSYGYNYQFLGNTRFPGDLDANGYVNFPVRISTIGDLAGTVMAADCLGTAAGKPEKDRVPNLSDGSREPNGLAEGGHGYALDPPRLTSTSDFADTRLSAPEHRSGPHERHAKRANVVFCDGHAKAMTAEELGYVKDPDGAFTFDGGGQADNGLFSGTGRDLDPPPAI